MRKKTIDYYENSQRFKGYVSYSSESQKKRPLVLVCHAWFGQDDFAREKADNLADIGYVGFAVDMFGDGKCVDDKGEASELIKPLLQDRLLIRRRLLAAIDEAKKLPEVDAQRIGVIGYCFGGACALELARSGADIRGAVTFHGLLDHDKQVQDEKIKAAVLVLHGYLDPLVSKEDIETFQKEMNDGKVDWQMNVYGKAMHAFTNPNENSPETGLQYNKEVSERSWIAMEQFFKELL